MCWPRLSSVQGAQSPRRSDEALTKTSYRSMMGATVKFDDHNQAHNNAVVVAIEGGKVVVKSVFPTE